MNQSFEALKPLGTTEKVLIKSGQASTSGEIVVQSRTPNQRIVKTLKVASLCLIITAVSALIPIVHFLLVPILLVVSVVIVTNAYRCSKVILGGEGKCPACHATFEVFARSYDLPFNDVCSNCHRECSIEAD